ncbi:MAG TPA: peptide deformylase [Gammaproteobacteria bacterium]|nr:MAG: peptide deformylase [Gammaproteobacteria bacterium TMED134]RZO70452.1 MAG: peptide deformylase [OM182 bacterium]HAL42248.1 peptide deformylase [Gammaproteobacteria bacterium]HBK17460.1 peptide deformylase [Gammaproteobacteria bacterium]|tara:strand:+ start:2690 stop:3184 length:495 start_codon:yes stop_codon:yes gene_type:complete
MSLLEILHHPDARLRLKAKPVTTFDAALAKLAEDMLETMYAAPGIGLAATQVNVQQRLIVVDVSEHQDQPHIFVNPALTLQGSLVPGEEGCLSVPGVYDAVARAPQVTVEAQDLTGKAFTLEAEGMLGVCIQHECDHLEGKLFVDYLSSLKRNRITKQLKKQKA